MLSDANFCGQCGVKLRTETPWQDDRPAFVPDALPLNQTNDVLSTGLRDGFEAVDSSESLGALLDEALDEADSVSPEQSLEMAIAQELEDQALVNNDDEASPLSPITEPLSDAEAQWLAEDDDDDDLDDLELSWEAPPGPPPEGVDSEEAAPAPVTNLGDFEAIAAGLGGESLAQDLELEEILEDVPSIAASDDANDAIAAVETDAADSAAEAADSIEEDFSDPWGDRSVAEISDPSDPSELEIDSAAAEDILPIDSLEEASSAGAVSLAEVPAEGQAEEAQSDQAEPETITILQDYEKGQLVHLQTNTTVLLPRARKVVHIGKANNRVPPDIDVSDFPHAEIVSRVHADVHWDGSSYYLEDTGSANGTYVNSWPLPSHRRYQLRDGDRITLGKHDLISFVFQIVS